LPDDAVHTFSFFSLAYLRCLRSPIIFCAFPNQASSPKKPTAHFSANVLCFDNRIGFPLNNPWQEKGNWHGESCRNTDYLLIAFDGL
jgi:hypothetical protein